MPWRHAVCWQSMSNICSTAWGKFMRIIAIPISKHLSHSNPGKDFNACASSVLLYESETKASTVHDIQLRHWKERSMVRWICDVRDDNKMPVYIRFAMSGLQEVDAALRTRRLSLVDTLHFPPHAQGWTHCTFLLIHMETRCTLLLMHMGRHIASSSSCTKVDTLQSPPHAHG